MNIVDEHAFEKACGKMMPLRRNMATFIGDPFQCACGGEHRFSGATSVLGEGFNGKFVVVCPDNPYHVSLIKTKMKFGLIYQGLEYLAGSKLSVR